MRGSAIPAASADSVLAMASYVPPADPGGSAGSQQPGPREPIPGWRKPIALVGWGVLIAVLIALIVWGIIQLVQGPPPPAPITTAPTTTTTTPKTTTAPAATLTSRPSTHTGTTSASPTYSTDTATPTSPSPSPGAFPHLPSVITLPSLPGLPTEITLPPGL